MNRKNAISQSSVLQGMVKVKKIRFKEETNQSIVVKPTRDSIQRQKNFQEFKKVYRKEGDDIESITLATTMSQTQYKYPRARKEPNFIETITLELPFNYGADRAIVQCKNKIRPKKSIAKVSREVLTENPTKPKEQTPEKATSAKLPHLLKSTRSKKEKISKTIPKHATPRPKKRPTKDKISSALSTLNDKLKHLQKKYLIQDKAPYRSVNDCFTQIGNVEVLYENEKYPHEAELKPAEKEASGNSSKEASKYSMDNVKMRERIKEMDELFPEFPKIEDTLKEIEIHLDNIANIDAQNGSQNSTDQNISNNSQLEEKSSPNEGQFNSILDRFDKEHSTYPDDHSITEKILKNLEFNKGIKLRSIRRQIDAVEDVCHKLSQIVRDQSDCMSSEPLGVNTALNEQEKPVANSELSLEDQNKDLNKFQNNLAVPDYMEGPNLQQAVKKSSFLSKEMAQLSNNAMVKVFSDHQRKLLLRERQRTMMKNEKDEFSAASSITKLIDSLRQTFEDSFYEPVCPK